MPSIREQVVQAVVALVGDALPAADVRRNGTKPLRIGPGGTVVVRDGDPGAPVEVLLSPVRYTYEHRVTLEIGAFTANLLAPSDAIDIMLQAIAGAIALNRTLGGLCEWVEPEAPVPSDLETEGSDEGRWADCAILCVYGVSPTPLS